MAKHPSDSEFERRAKDLAAQYPNDLVALYSLEGNCLWASPSHYYVIGYTPEEMAGESWIKFVAPEDVGHATLAGDDAFLNGRSIEVGMRFLAKAGERVFIRGITWVAYDRESKTGYIFFQGRQRPSRRT